LIPGDGQIKQVRWRLFEMTSKTGSFNGCLFIFMQA